MCSVELAALVRKTLERCPAPAGTKTRVVERGSRSIRSQLVRSNPFPRTTCGRDTCPLRWQEEGCKDRCSKEQVGYSSHCSRCRSKQLEEGVPLEEVGDKVYYGESSRTLHTRANQHLDDYLTNVSRSRQAKNSWMWDHTVEEHEGRAGDDISKDYTFRLMGIFRDCLGRQSDEAVRLEMAELLGRVVGDRGEGVGGKIVKVLNSRGEFFQPKTVKHIFYQQ